jgi:predicted PurR-regulated permease PerM
MQEKTARAIRLQLIFWTLAFVVFIVFMWLFSDILLPFIAGMALAYFLDPVADALERLGLSRMVSTAVIMVGFLIVFILMLMLVIPILANQMAGLMERLPELVARLQELLASRENTWLKNFIGVETTAIQENLNSLITQGAGFIKTVLQSLWASGKSLVSVVSLLVVTPVVAFYMLYDWDNMVAKVDGWLPRHHRETIRSIMHDIDKTLAGFVRGQGSLCLVLGLFYGISLTVVGLNFGLLIGLVAGLISFIPYVGSTVGLVLAIGVAVVQFWPEYWQVILVAGVFFAGQFLEGNILQPKMVGDSVNLHPVWLMFALFAFGSLFGFTGMLVAVPVAASLGVVIRFAIDRYLESELYNGHE